MQITVSQHIFTNVPKEQSPQGKRGYQTLLYSRADLSRDDVLLLEERALYYGGESEPVKYQFWMLPGGRAVVSRTLPLPEPDEFGRKGRYFAHNLVVHPADFQTLGFYPLLLLREQHFMRRPEEALAQGDARTGDLAPRRIEVNEQWMDAALQLAGRWGSSEITRLASLGWNAQGLRAQRRAVALLGDSAEQLRALTVAFLLSPPDLRPQLTFDTYTNGCDWSRKGFFWAWGGMEDPRISTIQVDCASLKVIGDAPEVSERPFARWVAQDAIPKRLRNYKDEHLQVLLLETVLQGKHARVDSASDTLGSLFCTINQQAVLHWLVGQYPPELTEEFRRKLATRMGVHLWEYFKWAAPGLDASQLADSIYDLLTSGAAGELGKGDYKPLSRLAAEAGDSRLGCVLLFYSGDRRTFETALGELSPADYREVAEQMWAKQQASALDLFLLQRLPEWSRIPGLRLGPGDLEEALKRIKKAKEPVDADGLMPLLPALQGYQRQLLIEWLQSYTGPATQLRASLRIPEPEQRSLRGRLRGLLGRE